MDYLDLYLIHMPVCQKPGPPVFPARREDARPFDFKGVWQAMEECQRLGLARAIGVSNFRTKHLDKMMHFATITPAVNQVADLITSRRLITRTKVFNSSCLLRARTYMFAGGGEPGLPAAEAEGVLRREGHPRPGVLAVGRPELGGGKKRRARVRGPRGDSQGEREDRGAGFYSDNNTASAFVLLTDVQSLMMSSV